MKVKYTELAIASGKLNGTVHARNKSGNYIRKWAKPTNPKSEAQLEVRQRMSALSRMWATLSLANKEGWNNLGNTLKRANRIGEIVGVSGIALFNEFNGNLAKIGESSIEAVPVKADLLSQEVAFDDTEPANLTLTTEHYDENHTLVIYATPRLSKGVTNPGNRFVQILTRVGNATPGTVSVDITAAYTARFGTPLDDDKIFVKYEFIRASYPISAIKRVTSCIVATV